MTLQSDESFAISPQDSMPDAAASRPSDGADSDVQSADAKEKLTAAKEESAAVAHSAVEAGKDVAHEAASQVSAVAAEAKDQIGAVLGQVGNEFKSQMDAGGKQVANGLLTLSTQLSALSQGRPQEAGHIGALVDDAQQRVQSYAQTLQTRGPQAIVEDLSAFARRRPGMFLLAATAGGFAIGRLVRSGAAANKQDASNDEQSSMGWNPQHELVAQT